MRFTVILATYNDVVEYSPYKVSSICDIVFGLVVVWRSIELSLSTKFLVNNVSGKQIMDQEVDGGSRRSMNTFGPFGETMIKLVLTMIKLVLR